MNWTEEQREVIETRDKNILVSAAAGSGKTAVLTERILTLVTDKEHPVDIDRLVVVTFTRAAAAEMRERILKALQKKAEESGNEDAYLQKQLSYVHNARITTIDSFCMDVVRENFAALNIDPVFKIGEEGELVLLKADVIAKIMEEHYEKGEEDFLEFIDIYSSNRSDEQVEEMIFTLYEFAMSYPYPEEWVQKAYQQEGDITQSDWYQILQKQLELQLGIVSGEIRECLELTEEEDGPWAYKAAVLSDKVFLDAVLQADSYEERRKLFAGYAPEALSRKKQPEADEKKKQAVKDIRDGYKKLLKGMAEKYYAKTMEEIMEDTKIAGKNVKVLAELVLSFMREYAAAKREKNLVDFSDIEHFALEILTQRQEDGTVRPSQTALTMAADIEEIMIDEYQDSNYVQEMILNSISGKGKSAHNLFMVGDVKQSIYKFRMAKPEIFLEKYNRFERMGDGPDRKIILSKNFRSRAAVLNVTNRVFEKIMIRELGGIVYDEENALYPGADYEGEDPAVELLIADTSVMEGEENLENDVEAKELEAEMAALRLKELYDSGFRVRDKADGKMRQVRYSDMAVLLRSMGSYKDVYERVLKSKGIPVRCPVRKGCFDAFEVKMVLEFLSVIDNPRQDIPLTAVLKNMFHMSEEEIAQIKLAGGQDSMYENVMAAGEVTEQFRTLLEKYRREKTYRTIYDLINEILEDTGFEYFIAAFPDGTMRLANLSMLKERASIYQQGSYSGLFNFIRYIEKNQEYEVQQETMSGAGEEDAVTIMSIHKSKGLEYPVVLAGALGKRFNQEDASRKVVLHQTFGIGMDRYDTEKNRKSSTLVKRAIAGQIVMENMAEELRVLYVAMTRAKEKLILAGSGKMEKKWAKYERLAAYAQNRPFQYNQIMAAGSYLDLLLMSLTEGENHKGRPKQGYIITVKTAQELAETLIREAYEKEQGKEVLEHWNSDHIYDKEAREEIEQSLAWQYPYSMDVLMKAKVSIADVKQKIMNEYAQEPEELTEPEMEIEQPEIVPAFLGEGTEEESVGIIRGNAYHRVFQILDYGRDLSDYGKINAYLDELAGQGLLQEKERKFVRNKDILQFLRSDVGIRMKAAWQNGTLKREQQFVMGVPASLVEEGYEGSETVLVQGIMDAYFEEDGQMCLVDYKTDFVDDMQELKKRYQGQMNYYSYALERISGKKVKNQLVYSVHFGETIEIGD